MLERCRVHDDTTGIAGPYCTKLLADAGARVTRYEPPGGDPLRRWGSGGLYEYLNAAKAVEEGPGPDPAEADVYVTDAIATAGATRAPDVADGGTVTTGTAGATRTADVAGTTGTAGGASRRPDVAELLRRNPALVVVTISPFGPDGPWAGRPATEFTLQAATGSTGGRGRPEQPPVAAGGRLGEWITGTYAAVGALAALRTARRHGRGEHVDVAMFDVMAATMVTFPSVFADFQGWPDLPRRPWTVEVPSIEPTADGYVVFTTNSAQQFNDFLVLIGRPDLLDDRELAASPSRFARRDEFLSYVHEYTTKRPSDEVLAEAALFRIPSAPVLTGETVPTFEHFVERGVFRRSRSGRHVEPRVPYRIEPGPRPATTADHEPSPAGEPPDLPLAGVRVLDCTAWWAGPSMSHALACLGADVIKVESTARPDQMRFTGTKPPAADQWWEWGALFHAVNTNKRGITLDLTSPDGLGLFERLVETADMVVENYTPRVMDNFGLGWERLSSINPRLVMVRMPAFGLDGPWRDRTGFAQTMESITGMAWLTGYPDGPPTLVRGACDPVAGMHAVVAALVALDERDRTGGGQFVEVPMVEAALVIAAEQVIEHSATGTVLTRQGNRGPLAAPQGLYPCRQDAGTTGGPELWVAIAVADDDQWRALRRVLGDPEWARDDKLDEASGRRSEHDRIDAELARWTGAQPAEDAVAALVAAGVPAEVVIPNRAVAHNPQIRHRRLLEPEDHPVTGRSEIPGLPFRLSRVDRWLRRPSPTLGQHNDEILDELGVPPAERRRLRAEGVIGETVVRT
jgi:crotonobetainyl-CoA:carnitine CoA-transferase CaiB-like acyl-CoA transferase